MQACIVRLADLIHEALQASRANAVLGRCPDRPIHGGQAIPDLRCFGSGQGFTLDGTAAGDDGRDKPHGEFQHVHAGIGVVQCPKHAFDLR